MPAKVRARQSEMDGKHKQLISDAFGCLQQGKASTYNGSDSAPTQTIYVCAGVRTYAILEKHGAHAIEIEEADWLWEQPIEQNMTQFEFHE